MDAVTILIGTIIIMFGLYTLFARINAPEKFTKLQVMRAYFGSSVGTVIHTIAYSIIPIGVGVYIIYSGINGIPIMRL